MDKPSLTRTGIHVVMDDGAEFTLETINYDMVGWDRHRALKHEPSPGDAPFVWLTFLSWHHLTKVSQELPPTLTLAEFERAAVVVEPADREADDVDPTNPAPEGS